VPESRGRPLVWLGMVIMLWVGGRVAGLGPETPVPKRSGKPGPLVASVADQLSSPTISRRSQVAPVSSDAVVPVRPRKSYGFTPALAPWQDSGRPSGLLTPLRVVQDSKPLSTGRDTPPTNALAPPGKAGTHYEERRWGAELYAYSFWRFASADRPALAPGAQYGGSQSGMIATIDPFGEPDRGLALLARGAVTPDGEERELSFGLRWKPAAGWPILLSAERRLRANAPDHFTAYLSGGVDALKLPGRWQLDAYGQMGYASGRNGGEFFDAQARLTQSLGELAGTPVAVGVGGWAGGQRGSKRMDVGPTVNAKINAGPTFVLVQLDWRLRVAGNARPKDGLALTLSTGF
jgi:hypothetical protein